MEDAEGVGDRDRSKSLDKEANNADSPDFFTKIEARARSLTDLILGDNDEIAENWGGGGEREGSSSIVEEGSQKEAGQKAAPASMGVGAAGKLVMQGNEEVYKPYPT